MCHQLSIGTIVIIHIDTGVLGAPATAAALVPPAPIISAAAAFASLNLRAASRVMYRISSLPIDACGCPEPDRLASRCLLAAAPREVDCFGILWNSRCTSNVRSNTAGLPPDGLPFNSVSREEQRYPCHHQPCKLSYRMGSTILVCAFRARATSACTPRVSRAARAYTGPVHQAIQRPVNLGGLRSC